MITTSTFNFLKDLKIHNNKDWFAANRPRYEEAKAEFIQFIDSLILEIAKFDNTIAHHQAKNCIFRINRDIRFSKDKSPYKTNFGAHITAAHKKSEIHSRAGYYIHLEPGNSMLAGGAYMPEKDWLKNIRQEIDYNAADFKKILDDKDFKKYFKKVEGEQLKTAPREYPKDHPEIALLRYKSFLATHPLDDKTVLSKKFLDHAAEVFKALYPFDQFLNSAVI